MILKTVSPCFQKSTTYGNCSLTALLNTLKFKFLDSSFTSTRVIATQKHRSYPNLTQLYFFVFFFTFLRQITQIFNRRLTLFENGNSSFSTQFYVMEYFSNKIFFPVKHQNIFFTFFNLSYPLSCFGIFPYDDAESEIIRSSIESVRIQEE